MSNTQTQTPAITFRSERERDLLRHIYSRCARTDSGCLEWQGGASSDDYGYAFDYRYHTERGVHRIVYEFARGPIPDRYVVDHQCRNRRCVEPTHLDTCTIGENVRRGAAARRDISRQKEQNGAEVNHE